MSLSNRAPAMISRNDSKLQSKTRIQACEKDESQHIFKRYTRYATHPFHDWRNRRERNCVGQKDSLKTVIRLVDSHSSGSVHALCSWRYCRRAGYSCVISIHLHKKRHGRGCRGTHKRQEKSLGGSSFCCCSFAPFTCRGTFSGTYCAIHRNDHVGTKIWLDAYSSTQKGKGGSHPVKQNTWESWRIVLQSVLDVRLLSPLLSFSTEIARPWTPLRERRMHSTCKGTRMDIKKRFHDRKRDRRVCLAIMSALVEIFSIPRLQNTQGRMVDSLLVNAMKNQQHASPIRKRLLVHIELTKSVRLARYKHTLNKSSPRLKVNKTLWL